MREEVPLPSRVGKYVPTYRVTIINNGTIIKMQMLDTQHSRAYAYDSQPQKVVQKLFDYSTWDRIPD